MRFVKQNCFPPKAQKENFKENQVHWQLPKEIKKNFDTDETEAQKEKISKNLIKGIIESWCWRADLGFI